MLMLLLLQCRMLLMQGGGTPRPDTRILPNADHTPHTTIPSRLVLRKVIADSGDSILCTVGSALLSFVPAAGCYCCWLLILMVQSQCLSSEAPSLAEQPFGVYLCLACSNPTWTVASTYSDYADSEYGARRRRRRTNVLRTPIPKI